MPVVHASLRNAAILVSCLDEAEARDLLTRLGPSPAGRIREALSVLGTTSRAERERVIRAFLLERPEPQPSQPELEKSTVRLAGGVELDEDLARRLAENSSPQSAAGPGTMNGSEPAERGPFAFLVHADADVVAKFLSRESPQTVAVVLSFLQRSHAAELLRRLDTALQAQVLKRLARLEAIDPACVDVLAVALEDWIAREQFSPRPPGQRGNAQLNQIPQAAASSQEEWVAQLQRDVSHGFALSTPAERPAPSATAAEPETHPRPERPAPLEFRDLLRLNTDELLRTFRAVPRDVLALALAGADEELIRRLTQNVPRREAKQLNKRLRFDGPTRLDDIEAAQGRVAEIATAIVREVTD